MKKDKNNIIWILPSILIMVLLILIKSCTPRINEKYRIGRIEKGKIDLYVEAKGEILGEDLYPIGLDPNLKIDKIYIKEGDRVKKGQVLIKFSDYEIENLENKLEEKQRLLISKKFQRDSLQAEKSLGDNREDENIAKLEGEIYELENESGMGGEKKLLKRVITSPIDGFVVKIDINSTGKSQNSEAGIILAKNRKIKVVSEAIDMNYINQLKVGDRAEMFLLRNSNVRFEGILSRKLNIDKHYGALEFKIKNLQKIPINLKDILNIKINYGMEREGFIVPVKSILELNNKFYIYSIDRDNKITEKNIKLGRNNGKVVEIFGNVKEKEEIVLNPNIKLRNNVIVMREDIGDTKNKNEQKIQLLEKENQQNLEKIKNNNREIIKLKREL